MEMNKPELVSEEKKNEQCIISWIGILKVAIIFIIVVLLFLLAKDYLMPREEIALGVQSPSAVEFSVINAVEAPSK